MKFILTLALCLSMTGVLSAQTIKKDLSGNYIQVSKDSVSKALKTGNTFTDSKGVVYPLYKGSKGGLFYNRVSKAGKEYKVYIKGV